MAAEIFVFEEVGLVGLEGVALGMRVPERSGLEARSARDEFFCGGVCVRVLGGEGGW